MAGQVFEWYKDKSRKFRFRLRAANGEIIAVSQAYASKEGCLKAIESVKKNAPKANIVERTEFKCIICGATFPTEKQLMEHIEEKHGVVPYSAFGVH